MIRKSLFALSLVLASTGAAFADTANDTTPVATPTVQIETLTVTGEQSAYPSKPGPYTVIYREWSDLLG